MLEIDGRRFDVTTDFRVTEMERSFEKLSSDQSGRTQDGEMCIFLIGVYNNYKMTVSRGIGCSLKAYDELFELLSAPVPFNVITVPYGQGTITFEAYITKGSQKLIRQHRKENYWGPITISFVAKSPQKTP